MKTLSRTQQLAHIRKRVARLVGLDQLPIHLNRKEYPCARRVSKGDVPDDTRMFLNYALFPPNGGNFDFYVDWMSGPMLVQRERLVEGLTDDEVSEVFEVIDDFVSYVIETNETVLRNKLETVHAAMRQQNAPEPGDVIRVSKKVTGDLSTCDAHVVYTDHSRGCAVVGFIVVVGFEEIESVQARGRGEIAGCSPLELKELLEPLRESHPTVDNFLTTGKDHLPK